MLCGYSILLQVFTEIIQSIIYHNDWQDSVVMMMLILYQIIAGSVSPWRWSLLN